MTESQRLSRDGKAGSPGRLWAVLALAASLAGAGLLGCAEERTEVNRVQPWALKKSMFVGPDIRDTPEGHQDDPEFYMRATVVDVGYGAMSMGLFTSTWAQPLSRIKWEITEDYLNARLTYELIEGSDGKGSRTTDDGQIVASFRILSHFDIRRQYNPVNGEEYNVVVENTTDRPWYEREYMRVDWSENLVTDSYQFDTLTLMGIYGAFDYEPISYTVLDPDDPDAPHFEDDGSYFDITNAVFAQPQMIDISQFGWGIDKIPACWFPNEISGGTYPVGNCNPVELTLRLSFRKVVDTDYEPVDVDGVRFQAYGNFTTENDRFGYDRQYGVTDERWHRFAARYDLWERNHYYDDPDTMTGWIPCNTEETTIAPTGDPDADPNRDEDHDGTADECEKVTELTGVGGSQCDVFKHRCTLPYRLRKPVTIHWHVIGDTDNEDYFEASDWATQGWDMTLKTTVNVARQVECKRTGGDPAKCEEDYPMWKGQQQDNQDAIWLERELVNCYRNEGWEADTCKSLAKEIATKQKMHPQVAEVVTMPTMLTLCHNPVIDSDHPSCGPVGTVVRPGDLRYHTINLIEAPQTPSPWGIMVDCNDPLTGEKVAASVNVWTFVNDLAAQGTVDLVRYANGELATEDITNGEYIRKWSKANRLAGGTTMSKEEVAQRLAAITTAAPSLFLDDAVRMEAIPSAYARAAVKARDIAKSIVSRADIPSTHEAEVRTRAMAARGTSIEAKLINPAMLQLAGIPGDMPLTGPIMDMASPLALNNPKVRAEIRNMREIGLARRGACILNEAPEATAVTGLADVMAEKFPKAENETPEQAMERAQKMLRYFRKHFHYSVIAHEMGHSFGLRHNFVSSWDSLFFRPQYWQLRTRNGQVTQLCDGPVDDGTTCVGPRYWDPITEDERTQLIQMFQQSSIMDYPGDISQDMIGIGAWDIAAVRFIYTDTVAVYDDPDIRAGTDLGYTVIDAMDTFGGMLGIQFSIPMEERGEQYMKTIHYSQLNNVFQLIRDCEPIEVEKPLWWDEAKDGKFHPVLDGHFVAVDGEYEKCHQIPVDYVAWKDLRMPADDEILGYYRGGPSVDPQGRLRVPYGFATDHWADLGNVSVFRHDSGADPYEQMMFFITVKENRHIIDDYRRGKATFSVRHASDRSYGRYLEKMMNAYAGMGFFANIYRRVARDQGLDFEGLWPIVVGNFARENVLAATMAFDQFVRELSRPEDGGHYLPPMGAGRAMRSLKDPDGPTFEPDVIIPNGSTGYLRDVGFGGRPIENALSETEGDFRTDYTMNAGSYYDKISTAILFTESEDRFISESRSDFYDARFRAAGFLHLFPDGVRRVIANALTWDRSLLAPRLAADASGHPLLEEDLPGFQPDPLDPNSGKYPARPIGWTSWWPKDTPVVCFPSNGRNICEPAEGADGMEFDPDYPEHTVPVDPQIGWEVQKFLIAWTLLYATADDMTQWVDMMRIWRAGTTPEPLFEERIEWQDPQSGQIYYAKTYGTEVIEGQEVQKGIAARVLEYANELTEKGYQNHGRNEYGRVLVDHHPDGTPIVKPDGMTMIIGDDGYQRFPEECDRNEDPDCTPLSITANRWASMLREYKSVPDFMIEVVDAYGMGSPDRLGVFDL